ncbi:bifunctional 3-(3-hydroxy-phenyl)propionate/3-hydroxycinnamic acid hydroxylase [Nocardioides sp. 503]|uniref:bifunctional 3-(3-hydroxy-phenyl)propionate/3-hydroxycinnamic acid hydroxylase MhpA n=1 Tax=Nocardioides sp. 503 TaxID=2508326 RepID=UPI0010702CEB|nr:bifunctional 3-(3-hydroxy-phenyl)propionate/3-hydroxycinnamic acid hydroxylase [Nocardioides sp. 503]
MSTIHDVVVVGAGPVGLMTAQLLGRAGHDVVVLERWPVAYPRPRAVHFDHEIGRLLQDAGVAEEVAATVEPVRDLYEWRAADGRPLVKIDWSMNGPSGWPIANFFTQPELERVLAEAVAGQPTVELRRGAEVVGIAEHDDHVEVSVADGAPVRARYVVGCDGANSFVREHMSTGTTDLGFYFDWLIVDTIPTDDREWSPMNWQLCDPARPTTIVSGGPGRRRWEFMRLPHEDPQAMNSAETAWSLLGPWGRTPDNTILERHAVYTFQARWADEWREGRLLLAGDAAHLMPPFAGQGMCSGLRDAANLTWKLSRVLSGTTSDELLDTYAPERKEHLQHAISISVALGRIICVLDPEEARERDERMVAGGADPAVVMPPLPPERLGPGCWDDELTPEALRGTLTPQFTVERDGARGRFDDLVGSGLTLVGHRTDPRLGLDPAQQAHLDALGVTCVVIDAAEAPAGPTVAVRSTDESPAAYFGLHGVTALLVRPDFYLYGAAASSEEMGTLVERLTAQVLVEGQLV